MRSRSSRAQSFNRDSRLDEGFRVPITLLLQCEPSPSASHRSSSPCWGAGRQFIPDTGQRYGLKYGPYYKDSRVDLADERPDWEKATRAAASYIKDIYATDAQASGLLVMASYHWGERRVIERLRKMPLNPRERNFWTLLAQYPEDIPPETYNYVFSIVSAAVIGENPRLFGFQFDNPLAFTGSSR